MVRLTEWIWKLIPKKRWCISKWAICDFQWGDGWWARKGDNRWGAGTARGLNIDHIVKIARLTGCKNFVGRRKKFIFNAFVDLKPVERSENGIDMWYITRANCYHPLSDSIVKVLLFSAVFVCVCNISWTELRELGEISSYILVVSMYLFLFHLKTRVSEMFNHHPHSSASECSHFPTPLSSWP